MRFKFGCPEKTIPHMSTTSRSCQFAVGQTLTTLGTSSASAAHTFSLSRSFFEKEYRLRTTSKRFSRFGQSTAVKSASMSNFSSSRRCSAISTNRARSEEHTSELQSRGHRVCRLLLEKKKYHAWFPLITTHYFQYYPYAH